MHVFPRRLYSENVSSTAVCRISISVDQILSRVVQYIFSDVNMNRLVARNGSPLHPPYLKSYDIKNTLLFTINFILLISIESYKPSKYFH
jgi:hypothetical protein